MEHRIVNLDGTVNSVPLLGVPGAYVTRIPERGHRLDTDLHNPLGPNHPLGRVVAQQVVKPPEATEIQ